MNLNHLAKKVAKGIKCDETGSCVVFADELTKRAQAGFNVVEGTVKFRGSIPFDHVWIEVEGKKIDPTLKQFSFFDLTSANYTQERAYHPREFQTWIVDHPEYENFSKFILPSC